MLTGDMVTCIGVSEPSGGSDVASIKSKAVMKGLKQKKTFFCNFDEKFFLGEDFVINGSKMWITNSLQVCTTSFQTIFTTQ